MQRTQPLSITIDNRLGIIIDKLLKELNINFCALNYHSVPETDNKRKRSYKSFQKPKKQKLISETSVFVTLLMI